MTTRTDIANMIFPNVTETIADLQSKYPARSESVVTRVAPSPTGFMHLGNFYSGLIANKFATQDNGIFFIRIEDTDQKRLTEWAVDLILKIFGQYDLKISEGPIGQNGSDIGNYGPYTQSQRKDLYEVFVKHLIQQGLAYPCWMSESEIESTREQQMKLKITPGIYGNYSLWRNKTPEEIASKIQENPNFVIRFRSHWDITKRVVFEDMSRGKVSMIDNYNDIVVIKSDGLPTYHLAHIADDTLMRTTHVIRGEEWLTSVPLHLQLFGAFDLPAPKYCHIAPLLKTEDGNKRKLSKRKDPEANMEYFAQSGFARQGVIEYLLTIIDSSFEDRQKSNPDKNYHDYKINLEKLNTSWALVDPIKLQSVNNNYLSRISTEDLYNQSLEWAQEYRPSLAEIMLRDPEYTKAALGIERHTEKDPKRFTTYQDIETQLMFFFDDQRENLQATKPALPENLTSEIVSKFVAEYTQNINLTMTPEDWFAQLKEIGKKHGFATNNAEFKEGGYIGKTGDLAMFLRIQLCCASRTPDLYSVMKILGKERVITRLNK